MVVTASISTAKTLISYHKDVGVGIGKMHERGALDVGGDMYVSGIIRQNNNQVIDTSNYNGYFDSRYNSKFNTDFDNRMNATFNGKFDSAYNNKVAVNYNKNIALGYGLQGRLVKRGNTVTISVWRQVINWGGSGEFKLLDETIPSDIIPVHEVNLILTKNAGSVNPPPMTIHIQKDGHMYFTNFNPGTWVHCGTVTYQLI